MFSAHHASFIAAFILYKGHVILFLYTTAIYLIVTRLSSFKSKRKKNMGLSLRKLAPGADEKKLKELDPIINELYEDKVKVAKEFPEFYRAVCEIVEKLNEKLGNTQIKLPKPDDLDAEYKKRHGGRNKALTKAEFQEIMQNLVKKSGFTGIGAKEAIICIFGVPFTALMVKQKVMPQAIRDEFLIPGVTSVTVFTLAALNKI
ncbi:UDP-D-xylose:L-fucose alpha-1,3-D-xylosyltransferase MGP4 [Spatholobus suberectus]|nr:UDP-D-xylose:L-fucose alpha-1,3-D-xylosyltransferase MGP4 [Spatholobus suberectus]